MSSETESGRGKFSTSTPSSDRSSDRGDRGAGVKVKLRLGWPGC